MRGTRTGVAALRLLSFRLRVLCSRAMQLQYAGPASNKRDQPIFVWSVVEEDLIGAFLDEFVHVSQTIRAESGNMPINITQT
jgi:hypothetical protein